MYRTVRVLKKVHPDPLTEPTKPEVQVSFTGWFHEGTWMIWGSDVVCMVEDQVGNMHRVYYDLVEFVDPPKEVD